MRKDRFDKKFYLVREDVLPEAMKKTLDAKEMIERGKAESVWDAVQKVDLSRSAFINIETLCSLSIRLSKNG